jgi:hypothetical protein
VSKDEWTAVPMQGSGTFAVEAVIQTATPRTGGKVRTFDDHLSRLLRLLGGSFGTFALVFMLKHLTIYFFFPVKYIQPLSSFLFVILFGFYVDHLCRFH